MAWTTPVAYTDVRAEYPLMTVALRANATVTVDCGIAEDDVEAVLRDKYALTDPGADNTVWRACLCRALVIGLNAVYASEGWTDEARSAVGLYYDEWIRFVEGIQKGTIKLSLDVSSTVQTPAVNNLEYGSSDYSQFDLDSLRDNSFPLVNDE